MDVQAIEPPSTEFAQTNTINLLPGFLPVMPYSSVIDSVNMPFEAVSATASGRGYLYEPSPRPNGQFNILFRNDQLGFASANTGFFFLFKQGVLQNQDFNLPERIANRAVNINIEGINNTDRWLYQLDNVGTITREWEFVESVYTAAAEQQTTLRPIYSVTSRANDQITMNFGDGVFSEIPVGLSVLMFVHQTDCNILSIQKKCKMWLASVTLVELVNWKHLH
jgi:hypothetical protein